MDNNNIGLLAVQAAKGEKDAFQRLYQLTRQRVYFVALSITKNETDAQDILQETYLRAYQSIGQLERPERFESWLSQIAANQAKNYLSKKRPASFAEYDDESAANWQEETDPEFLPDERLDLDETKKFIAGLVRELPEDQRLCVLLRYFEDMEVAAIATALEIPEGTVKSRLSRARQKLAAKLEEAQKDGGLKLYSFAPMPLLAYFLKLLSQDTAGAAERLPALLLGTAAAGAAAGAAGAAAGSAAGSAAGAAGTSGSAGTVAATFAAGALSKVIAAVTVAALAVGGTTAGVVAVKKSRDNARLLTTEASQSAAASGSWSQTGGGEPQWETSEGEFVSAYATNAQGIPYSYPARPSSQGGQTRAGSQQASQPQPQNPSGTNAGTSANPSGSAQQSTAAQPSARMSTTTTQPTPTTPYATTTRASGVPTTQSSTPATTRTTTTSRSSAGTSSTGQPTSDESSPTEPPSWDAFVMSGNTLLRYTGGDTLVTVPPHINGVPIKKIADHAFFNCGASEIVLPSGAEEIGWWAFGNCSQLNRVLIPESVTKIDPDAFIKSAGVTIVCKEGSYAHSYALRNSFQYIFV
ncbi:MAG: sigma-70 family RNA polymerase sigma factor [Oscillospiraceae bacterium]|nr:sigma-70 family RNA polymerase sigma factor [Oscillospiraceae bacterium]